jgi:hypothetical protein
MKWSDVRLFALFVLGSADMLTGKVLHSWPAIVLGGFAAGFALLALLQEVLQ